MIRPADRETCQPRTMKVVIPLYNEIREMVRVFAKHMQFGKLANKLGRKLKCSIEETISQAVFRHFNNIATKKAAYNILDLKKKCSYKTMVVNINRRAPLAMAILFVIMKINKQNSHPVKHIDYTDIPVCLFKNANAHKTMRDLAEFGRSAKGTFLGLEMSLISDIERRILAVHFTGAGANCRDAVIPMAKDMEGIFIADAGYVSEKLARDFYQEGKRILLITPRKNMKKLMTKIQETLCKTRMIIELNFRNLKMFHGLLTSLPRSIDGYFANYIYSLLSLCFTQIA